MDGGKCILQLRGVRPFLSDKYDITKHRNYRFLSDENPKNAFDVSKYLNRKLTVKPGDKFVVGAEIVAGGEIPEDALWDYQPPGEMGDGPIGHDEPPEDLEPV